MNIEFQRDRKNRAKNVSENLVNIFPKKMIEITVESSDFRRKDSHHGGPATTKTSFIFREWKLNCGR